MCIRAVQVVPKLISVVICVWIILGPVMVPQPVPCSTITLSGHRLFNEKNNYNVIVRVRSLFADNFITFRLHLNIIIRCFATVNAIILTTYCCSVASAATAVIKCLQY